MRVIGGTFGGRRLRAVEGHRTRPTSDRVREALFSRIEARYGLDGARILDVFSGTGALAIEAVSRGAARAVCVEMEKRAVDTLRGNVREFALETRVRVIADDYRRVLARLAGERTGTRAAAAQVPAMPGCGTADATTRAAVPQANATATSPKRFDGVFVDPPYGKGLAVAALEALAAFGLVRDGGWVSVEVGRREQTPAEVRSVRSLLTRVREDTYGDTTLALYEAADVVHATEAPAEPAPREEASR